MKEYNFKEIEKKWQDRWEEEKRFKCRESDDKEKTYILPEFPYPSGKGLHVGHMRPYTALDILARKARLENKNVLFPMGCDAFGLEAERTAIREQKKPQEIVERNIAVFKEQLKRMGFSFDWSREVISCDPNYYKWTQWLFLQFVKHGLAEKVETTVNFCPNCGVLANEEVEDGKCCQCHEVVVQKSKWQWMLKMSKYSQKLIDGLEKTHFMQHVKQSEINYIGRSEGVEFEMKIKQGGSFKIFTTCIETIYGITFVTLAPEHKLVKSLKDKIENLAEVEAYIKETAKKQDFERENMIKEKTGVQLKGLFAINPINGKEVPIYIGDFVLASYADGAVMAVPAHDQRDFDFAKEHNLPMIEVISGGNTKEKAFEKFDYLGKGCRLINSGEFSGLTVEEAKQKLTEKLIELGIGNKKVNYKLRDWVFSRQRYWGEPIPMIYCEKCGWVPVPESELPVVLPDVESYETTKDGESPLSTMPGFYETTCPHCGGKARRETDTMPGWAGSSWYFYRYCDPHNDKEFASFDKLKYWMPVDFYGGGNEHTNRHLLYARFWNIFLNEIGLVPTGEAFDTRFTQGIILGSNGVKMSKSLGNVVDPRALANEFGCDALRMWTMFLGDYTETASWNDDGVKACNKFLNKVWNLQNILVDGDSYSNELKVLINQTIKKVSEDINALKFNTAVSQFMICVNEILRHGKINNAEYKTLLILMNPFVPHITEEIWENCNFSPSINKTIWPKADESALIESEIEIPVQICSKVKKVIKVKKDANQEEVLDEIKKQTDIDISGAKKIIFVPNRIINIIK